MSCGPLSERMKSGRKPAGFDQLLENLNRLVCGDRACHFNDQDLAGELVDDVQVPQPSAGCGLVILVVDHKDVVLMLGSAAAWDQCQRSRSGSSLLLCGSLSGLPLARFSALVCG